MSQVLTGLRRHYHCNWKVVLLSAPYQYRAAALTAPRLASQSAPRTIMLGLHEQHMGMALLQKKYRFTEDGDMFLVAPDSASNR